MVHRRVFAAIVIAASLTSSCSGGKHIHSSHTSTSGVSASHTESGTIIATATSSAPRLDSSECVDVTGANLDLLTASDEAAARKAADTLERYAPPGSVKDAIEHFVGTGGAQFDDPGYTKNSKILDGWVKEVCPV